MSYLLYVLGIWYHAYEVRLEKVLKKGNLLVAIAGGFILLLLTNYGEISLMMAQIVNPAFFLLCSIVGWMMIIHLADFVNDNFKCSALILAKFGEKSIWVLLLHMWTFWLIRISFQRMGKIINPYLMFVLGVILSMMIALSYEWIMGFIKKESN
jgi:hypothetical protein